MQLAEVKQSFIQWRKIKKYNDSIPDYLWKEVSKIDKKYSVSEIYRALSISHKQYAANLPKQNNEDEFLQVKNPLMSALPIVPEAPVEKTMTQKYPVEKFQIQLTSGEKVLSMEVSQQQIPMIFAELKGMM